MSRQKAEFVLTHGKDGMGYQILRNTRERSWTLFERFGPVWFDRQDAIDAVAALNLREGVLAARRRDDARRRKAAKS